MRYFAVSDIHSFFSPLKKSLWNAGYRKSNPNHTLIVCGDVFDRGEETMEVYEFLKSIPQSRLILVKGNHELLYNELLDETGFPKNHQFSNGTVRTFCAIAGVDYEEVDPKHYAYELVDVDIENFSKECYDLAFKKWKEVQKTVRNSEVTKWINSSRWVNYFELGRYIFVHSFIPLRVKSNPLYKWIKYYPLDSVPNEAIENVPNWRTEASEMEWNDATWGCPWKQFKYGFFDSEIKDDKCLVCGHWHTSDFHTNLEHYTYESLEMYYSDNLIALDGCIAMQDYYRERYEYLRKMQPKRVTKEYEVFFNVLVIDENMNVYDRHLTKMN